MTIPNLPGRRRVQPKPFSRPSIDLDHHGRVWKDAVNVKDLKAGDTVHGMGLIMEVRHTGAGIKVWLVLGEPVLLETGKTVKAFVEKD